MYRHDRAFESPVLGSGAVDHSHRQRGYYTSNQYSTLGVREEKLLELLEEDQELGDFFDWLKKKGVTPEKVVGVAEVIAPEWTAKQKQRAAEAAARAGVVAVRERVTTQVQQAATNPVVWLAVGGLGLALVMGGGRRR